MKKILTVVFTILLATGLVYAPYAAGAQETKKTSVKVKKAKKNKKANSTKKSEKNAESENVKPAAGKAVETPDAAAANIKPDESKQPDAKKAETNLSPGGDRERETYIPRSSDIQNLLFASNDMNYLVPRDLASKWGLVLGYNYYKFVDEDKSSALTDSPSGADSPDFRFWLSKKLDNNDSYYARIRYARLNLHDDNNLAQPNSKNIGIKFDMLYYTFNRWPDMNIKIGRQFLRVGRGFTYANIHDGLYIDKFYPEWVLSAFAARTQPRESNNDQSNGGYLNRSYRDFYGFQADYLGLKNKKVYGYVLSERDGGVKIPYTTKDYTYNASFFGIGMDGSFKPNWPYYFEYVIQNGRTASTDAQTGTDPIKASAYYLGSEYYFKNNPCKPFLTLEYAHASGDPDRTSVTNVAGGNLAGTNDKNFMPFGIYDLGLALHPRFSNINVFKFGGFFKPFHKSSNLKELQLGAKYMIYTKDNANGFISDTLATVTDKNIGNGYDLYLTWRAYSDTLFYVNYGVFSPGNAYPAGKRDRTKLINVGTTLFF